MEGVLIDVVKSGGFVSEAAMPKVTALVNETRFASLVFERAALETEDKVLPNWCGALPTDL